jgi:hypothetical protein
MNEGPEHEGIPMRLIAGPWVVLAIFLFVVAVAGTILWVTLAERGPGKIETRKPTLENR